MKELAMKKYGWVGVVVVSALVAFLVVQVFGVGGQAVVAKETAYERVMANRVLRCGYASWEPGVYKDPQTGNMRGYWVEIMQELVNVLELKLEWADEVSWGNVAAALKSGKIDAMCAGMWQSAVKAQSLYFSEPVLYEGIEAVVRVGDKRFADDLSKLNDPAVTIIVQDNDNSDFIARGQFPKAKRVALPQMSGEPELFISLVAGKGDVIFVSPAAEFGYTKLNPGKVERLMPKHFLRVFGQTVVVDNAESKLLHMLNVAIAEASNSGAVRRVMEAYLRDNPEVVIKVAEKVYGK